MTRLFDHASIYWLFAIVLLLCGRRTFIATINNLRTVAYVDKEQHTKNGGLAERDPHHGKTDVSPSICTGNGDLDHFGAAAGPNGANFFFLFDGLDFSGSQTQQRPLVNFDFGRNSVVIRANQSKCEAAR